MEYDHDARTRFGTEIARAADPVLSPYNDLADAQAQVLGIPIALWVPDLPIWVANNGHVYQSRTKRGRSTQETNAVRILSEIKAMNLTENLAQMSPQEMRESLTTIAEKVQ